MIKLKKDAMRQIKLAIADRFEEIITAYNQADNEQVVELAQCGLLSYEDLVEPSKLSFEDEFWSCFSSDEKEYRHIELTSVLEYMQANKMALAMNQMADLKGKCCVSDTSAQSVFNLIEDFINNKEEYDA